MGVVVVFGLECLISLLHLDADVREDPRDGGHEV